MLFTSGEVPRILCVYVCSGFGRERENQELS